MSIKNIVFDFGGVLIDWNPRYLYKTMFDTEAEMEWFLANICTDAWNIQQDAGRTMAEATRILQSKHSNYHDLIQNFYDGWEQMLKGPIDENVALIELLQKKYRLFGLTNWSSETFPIALARYDFLHEFEDIVVSGDEKLIKPDPAIYEVLLNRNHLIAKECLFLDDNLKNIEAAKAMGFHTIHIDGKIVLKQELKELNVL